jgi:flagellar hook-associated protein 2
MSTVVSSTGIGSGLDINSIVTALTTAKAAPQTNALNRSNTDLNAQVSAFGLFSSALATFQATLANLKDPAKLVGHTATLADTTIATATATSSAVTGQYSLQVQNLATAASLSSQPVASATSIIGTGTLKIAVGGASTSITIDGTNNTLQGIVAAINSSVGNPGVTASIITVAGGARLILSGTATGAANTIKVTQSGGDGGLAALQYDPANGLNNLTQTQAAQDANFSVNGYAATSASNQVSGVITGVTLNLVKATAANTPTTLTIGNDTQGAQTSISTFVTALNGLQTGIQSLTSYNASTKAAGPLLGNQTVLAFQNQLSKILGQVNSTISSGPNSLAALGIAANTQGTFTTDSTALSNALSANLASAASLLAGPNGIATKIDTLVSQYARPGGLLDSINAGLQTSLSNNAKAQADLTARMAVYSATLTAQYNAMDTAVALLKQTQTYLSQAFNTNTSSSSSTSTSASTGLGSGILSTGA